MSDIETVPCAICGRPVGADSLPYAPPTKEGRGMTIADMREVHPICFYDHTPCGRDAALLTADESPHPYAKPGDRLALYHVLAIADRFFAESLPLKTEWGDTDGTVVLSAAGAYRLAIDPAADIERQIINFLVTT